MILSTIPLFSISSVFVHLANGAATTKFEVKTQKSKTMNIFLISIQIKRQHKLPLDILVDKTIQIVGHHLLFSNFQMTTRIFVSEEMRLNFRIPYTFHSSFDLT